ncbi:hypothetical protein [Ramlibacter albus]|uniref:Uncharacterized protein n=1 Tax=Ramlibacter albus TaxID=2079448 RepID=A0A923M4K6_9BURK|nr:hypothetical protein [Ramlibacter albus]MBC5763845.1 hypothetical protein [Ramlibacter albus]
MKQLDFGFPIPEGYEVIFRASITLKNGTVIYAKDYGIRGFPVLVAKAEVA